MADNEDLWTAADHDNDGGRLYPITGCGSDGCVAGLQLPGAAIHLTSEDLARLVRAAAPLAGLTVVDHPVPAVPPPPGGIHPRPYGDYLRLIHAEDLLDAAADEASRYCTHAEAGAITPHGLPSRNQHYALANAHRQRLDAVLAELARRATEADTVPRTPIARPAQDSQDAELVRAATEAMNRNADAVTRNADIAQYNLTAPFRPELFRREAVNAIWSGRRRGESDRTLWQYTEQAAHYIATGEVPA